MSDVKSARIRDAKRLMNKALKNLEISPDWKYQTLQRIVCKVDGDLSKTS